MRSTRSIIAVIAAVVAIIGTAGTASAAGPEPGAAALDTITIGTHNSLHGTGSFERFAGVIGWQEVTDPADRTKLNNRLGSEYVTYYPPDGPAKAVPISWRVARFMLISSGSVRTHAGEAGVTPARYVNWVVLEIRGTGKRLVVVNTHFISGAWSGHPERQARWNQHYRVLRDRVAALQRTYPGKPVFVVGDMNRHLAMTMPAPVRYVPVQGGGQVPLDHVYAPTNVSHTQSQRLSKWGSDHHAYRIEASF